jgi:hypothetical protein
MIRKLFLLLHQSARGLQTLRKAFNVAIPISARILNVAQGLHVALSNCARIVTVAQGLDAWTLQTLPTDLHREVLAKFIMTLLSLSKSYLLDSNRYNHIHSSSLSV